MSMCRPIQGFTLIELMIVVAIIGVLSAVAIPTYANYKTKSELSMGVNTLSSLLSNVDFYISDQGSFPGTIDNATVGMSATANRLGTISTEPDSNATAQGKLVFTYGEQSSVKDKKIVYTRGADASWICEQNVISGAKACSHKESL